ncbi:permease [bacterium]|nr:permease [bacterium]MCB2179258.1 permease [bacterium]
MRDKTPLVLIVVIIGLAVLAGVQQGVGAVLDGFLKGGQALWRTLPLLVAAFLVAGLTQALVTEEFVTRWLGSQTGWKGIALACLAGSLIPGGPYVYYPLAAVLLNNGAGLGVLVSFVAAKNLWSISRLPYEIALIGLDFTLARFAITLIFPPLIGFLTELLLGRFLPQVREGAPKV